MQNKVTVTKLKPSKPTNDWHGCQERWQVRGPLRESQRFTHKQGASLYARIRRKTKSVAEASQQFTHTINAL